MSYVENTLGPGEEIRHRGRFNWTYDAVAWFWFLLGASPLGVALYYFGVKEPGRMLEDPSVFIVSGASTFIGFLVWLGPMVHKWTTEIVVTNLRFVHKVGLIARKTQEVSLNKIEEINLNQTFWGRMFGYGQLIIRGTGVGVLKLPDLDEPIKLRRAIQQGKSENDDGD